MSLLFPSPADSVATMLGIAYSAGLALLVVHGLRVFLVTVTYLRVRGLKPLPGDRGATPTVTVQIPLYNERFVAARAIDAACEIDWPRDRFEVQVLDDSTDATRRIVDERAEWWRSRGSDVVVVRRSVRAGFKAGALADGAAMARGDVLAVLDADFVPPRDFLRSTVPFLGPDVAAVQARWGHLNAGDSGLTRAQALALDGYFLVDQTARSRSGHFLVFNGSGGIWQRAAVEAAGGWRSTTISEDVDLSYRAQLAGWRIVFLPDVVVPAELPASLAAYKRQQRRWACGTTQVLRKVGPRVARCDRSPWVRLVALLTLGAHLVHPVSLGLFLLAPIVMAVRPQLHLVVGLVALAAISPPLMYAVAAAELHRDWPRRLASYPLLAAIGAGLTLSGSVAVVNALTGRNTDFERTPKSGSDRAADGAAYGIPIGPMAMAEACLALYGWIGLALAIRRGSFGFVLFFALFAVGYTLTVVLTTSTRVSRAGRRCLWWGRWRPRARVGEP